MFYVNLIKLFNHKTLLQLHAKIWPKIYQKHDNLENGSKLWQFLGEILKIKFDEFGKFK